MKEFSGTMAEAGHLIRELRKARGWSQTDLASMVGISRTAVSELEIGKPLASKANAIDALAVLGARVVFFKTLRPIEAVQVDLHRHIHAYAKRATEPLPVASYDYSHDKKTN